MLNHSYPLFDEKSKGDRASTASMFTADPFRLASKMGQGAETEVEKGDVT